MIRLLLTAGLGAGLMYLFDPRQGRERRQTLMDRVGRGKAADFTERADEALQGGKDAIIDAKDRLKTTAGHAADRASETVKEVKSEASDWTNSTREKAQSARVNSNPQS